MNESLLGRASDFTLRSSNCLMETSLVWLYHFKRSQLSIQLRQLSTMADLTNFYKASFFVNG